MCFIWCLLQNALGESNLKTNMRGIFFATSSLSISLAEHRLQQNTKIDKTVDKAIEPTDTDKHNTKHDSELRDDK